MLYQPKAKKKRRFSAVYDWLGTLIVSIIAVIIILTFFFRIVVVDGSSMMDTLQHRDVLVMRQFNYKPEVGDIVIISRNYENDVLYQETSAKSVIIKRIIAVGGQTVDIDTEAGIVYVDGEAIDEPYIKDPTTVNRGTEYPLYVEEGKVFVMGDNRLVSLDSRSSEVGLIDSKYILGKAIIRLFPISEAGSIY